MNAFCLCLSLLTIINTVATVDLDNGLIGEPEVQCGADTVELQFRTKEPFRGKTYVKGHYTNPDCRVDYSQQKTNSRPTGGIVIHHGACDMERQRMISPQGMQFSAVVVISFHPTFITKIDKAFNVKCMYREMVKTVTTGIEVSMLTTQVLSYSFPMPICTYTIRRDQIDGEILRYARVGEQVVHRWECQSEVFGILVHSCVVEDGQGEKIEVVDNKGCHVDDYVLGDPTYIDALTMAYREAHVVKFADRVTVRFQCQIKLCIKMDGGCRGITPPICNGSRSKLAAPSLNGTQSFNSSSGLSSQLDPTVNSSRTVNDTNSPRFRRSAIETSMERSGTVDGDFNSQLLYVLDSTENPEKGSKTDHVALDNFLRRSGTIVGDRRGSDVCLSTVTFGLLMASVTVVFLAAAFVSSVICCQKLRGGGKKLPNDNLSSSSCYSSVVGLWKS